MTNYTKYQIVSRYDRTEILQELGIHIRSMAEVHRLQSKLYQALTPREKQRDRADLAALGLAL